MRVFQNYQKYYYVGIVVILLLLSSFQSTGMMPSNNQKDTTNQVSDTTTQARIDISLSGQIYLSKANPLPGEVVDIYVMIKNNGDVQTAVKIEFAISNDQSDNTYESSIYNISAGESKYGKISWTAQSGSNTIQAQAVLVDAIDVNPSDNHRSTVIQVDTPQSTDFAIYEEDITISSDLSGNYLIQGVVHNLGQFDGSVNLDVKDSSYRNVRMVSSTSLSIIAGESQEFSINYLPQSEHQMIIFQLKSPSIEDNRSDNNRVSKEFTLPDDMNSLDLTIDEADFDHEVIPGESLKIDLLVQSDTITDDFQVIVGGITDQFKISPDQWIISVVAGQTQYLQLDVSVKDTVTTGLTHTVEVQLYRRSNPSDIVKKSIDVGIVDSYTAESQSTIPLQSNLIPSDSITTDELNNPVISGVVATPTNPNYLENVTVNADVTDDSTISDVFLLYSYDQGNTWTNSSMTYVSGATYTAQLPTPGYGTNVTYYIQAYDNFTNSAVSNQYSFFFDGQAPNFSIVSSTGTVSYQDTVTIFANVSDNLGLDGSNIYLFYSINSNASFSMILMSQLNGSSTSAFYQATIPATTSSLVYYYIEATDLASLTNTSSIQTYQVDNLPVYNSVSISPDYPNADLSTTVTANITDDYGINNATLYYSYNSGANTGSVVLDVNGSIYSGDIPATLSDTAVFYNISTYDSYGHQLWSSSYSYYSDGIQPSVSNIMISDTTPNYLQQVNISATVTDTNLLRNITLYYSFDSGSSWNSVNMTGFAGQNLNYVKDALIVYSDVHDRGYLTRNGYTYDTMSAAAFSTTSVDILNQYRIIILEPNWSNYNYLRSGLTIIDQAMDELNFVVSIRVAGNGGSQTDIDFLGTDYDRSTTSNTQTILDNTHPFISGAPWSGFTLTTSNFDTWSSTDHGGFYNLPTAQEGYDEILASGQISMMEYKYKDSKVLVDTLTSIDGGWGRGNDAAADNYINYLNYTFYQDTKQPFADDYIATIPSAPADTEVLYYVNATDVANNSYITNTSSYFSDGSAPIYGNITQFSTISETDTATVNVIVSDNHGLDHSSVSLYYTFDNTTYYQLSMTLLASDPLYGSFNATIPATSNSRVYYYIEATDNSGLTSQSINSSYVIDLQPTLANVVSIPTYPVSNSSTTLNATITDDNGISSVTIYYNYNNTDYQKTMSLVDGIYQVTIDPTYLDTTVSYIIEITDTFGHVINSTLSTFYTDGVNPVVSDVILDPQQPNAYVSTLVSATISDVSGINNATLHYSQDGGGNWTEVVMSFNSGYWQASIPAFNSSVNIDYYVSTYDNSGYYGNSSVMTFQTDILNPEIYNITQLAITSETQAVTINATVTDNLAIDSSNVMLYYSTDNSTWFTISMSNITGNATQATFQVNIPPTSASMIYYYINATDLSGLSNVSSVYNYSIDLQPSLFIDSIDPPIPSAYSNVSVYTNITEDYSIVEATLYYSYNSVWYQSSAVNISGQFVAQITSPDIDTTVFYYISVVDSYGHRVNSTTFNYYADGILPTISNIQFSPTNPQGDEDITVSLQVDDNQGILNSTLYYTLGNGTWIGVEVNGIANTVSGRDPATGYYYGTTRTATYDSGPLTRLALYVYSGDSDTLYVTLSGYRIDTNTWEQFYYSGSRGSGNLPEQNWAQPIYDQWRIQIYDSENNDNVYYNYDYDTTALATIPATYQSANVEFYVEAFDVAGNQVNSSSYYFSTDVDAPTIANLSNPGITSELDDVVITATVDDIVGTDTNNVILYYSSDNSTFSSTQMTLISGDNRSGIFEGIIPASSQSNIYYYVTATDYSGLTGQSVYDTYSINFVPDVVSISLDPKYPDPSQTTIVEVNITDDDTITSVILNYVYGGTSGSTAMSLSNGNYTGTIPATSSHSDVTYYFTLSDSFGNSVNSQNYTYTSDGKGPVISSVNINTIPNYQETVTVTATVTDDTELNNVVLYYSSNGGISWTTLTMTGTSTFTTTIPAFPGDTTIHYYVFAQDMAGNTNTSSTSTYYVDGEVPTIESIYEAPTASETTSTTINVTISDNSGIDDSTVRLYYSYNDITYFQILMTKLGGTPTFGIYEATIPATSNAIVYYYVESSDLSGLVVTSQTYNYNIDLQPTIQSINRSPVNPNGDSIIQFETTTIDDYGIKNVTLHYNYQSVWYQQSMNLDVGVFRTSIGPLQFDGDLTYYVEIFDTFGHSISSAQVVQYIDYTLPSIENIIQNPQQPVDANPVGVTIQLVDASGIANATLYYTINGSNWNTIAMSQINANSVSGRDPATGYHYGTTRTATYDSGPLTRLALYVYSSDSDTLYVTLSGYRIDTNTWEQFYYSGSRGSGNLPEQNWVQPIYDQWRIQIYDSENNDNFYYNYDYDRIPEWQVNIPGYGENTAITYFIRSFDVAGNSIDTSNYSYIVDSTNPSISNISNPNYALMTDDVTIYATLSDYAGIDAGQSLLYYSDDNSNWFSTSLSLDSGTATNGSYVGIIPASVSAKTMYYYIETVDNSGYTSQSIVNSYQTLDVTIQLQSPSNGGVVNGTGETDLQFFIAPDNSTVEISFDQGMNWTQLTYLGSNQFTYTLNLSSLPEGRIEFSLNVTVLEGVYFIRQYSFYIDRSAPSILDVTFTPEIDGAGQSIDVVLFESVTVSNFVATLFYSYDNSTWYQTSMSFSSQYQNNMTYTGLLPSTTVEEEVFYYIYVEDNLGLTNQSITYQSLIDYQPVITSVSHNGEYQRSDTGVDVSVSVSDDRGISSVTLFYTINDVSYNIPMNFVTTNYVATIPASNSDGNVTYYVRVIDNFSHQVDSVIYEYYADGIAPAIENTIRSVAHANMLNPVSIFANVDDTNPLKSLELFYSADGITWNSIDFNAVTGQRLQGRQPVGGSFVNMTELATYDSGPLKRLSVAVSTTGNSLSVKLWGRDLNTGSFVLFYENSAMSTGQIPEFNWVNPVYDGWRIEITELDPTDGFSYTYDMNVVLQYQAQIPQSMIDGMVQYYIVATDMADQVTTSQVYNYYTDGLSPTISGITTFEPISQFDSPRVWANITDNQGVYTPVLYYSVDEITWNALAMIRDSGNDTNGLYYADIPAISEGIVAYYISSTDYYQLEKESFVWYYVIDEAAEVNYLTHYPTDVSLLDDISITMFASDDFGISSVDIYYWINGISFSNSMSYTNGAYQFVIDAVGNDSEIFYFIRIVDSYGHITDTALTEIIVDGTAPVIVYDTIPGESIPEASDVVIKIQASDNAALNLTSAVLYYSFDQVNWNTTRMQWSGGTTLSATLVGLIPSTPTNFIHYYTTINDQVGLSNSSQIMSFYLETFPDADADGVADWTEVNIYQSDPNNNDTDSDNVSDYDEIYVYGTDVNNADTDGDGMPDGWEIDYDFDPLVSDGDGDRDGDGLTNEGEYLNNTDPDVIDTDADGMTDGFEVQYGLDPLVDDSEEDRDGDNLTNLNEFDIGTNPSSNDTEADGMPDGWEYLNSLDPLVNDSLSDADSDDLLNIDEFINLTDPQNADTDGDRMTDGWEVRYGLNPLIDDSAEDPDNDGFTNIEEFVLGSDPNDPDSPGDNIGIIIGLGAAGLASAGAAFGIRRSGGLQAVFERLRLRFSREE